LDFGDEGFDGGVERRYSTVAASVPVVISVVRAASSAAAEYL